jgi:geranylgeranyl pyrophosphate synthase
MFDAHRVEQSREDYEKRIYGKTASLFAASTEMGAVIAGADEDHVQALKQFGADVGMAFQIVDDLLDITRESSDIGKPAGNDLRQGTVTLPVMIYARDLAQDSEQAKTLRGVIEGDITDAQVIDELVRDLRQSPAIDESLEAAREFADRAKARIEVVPDPRTRDLLADVADLAFQRLS